MMTRHVLQRLCAALLMLCGGGVARAHAALTCGQVNASGAAACFVDPAVDPGALCNDGSAPAFWFRPGSGAGAKTWVIWLEGGGQCTSQASCASRARGAGARSLTSAGFTAGNGAGVLSASRSINPMLYDANAVLIHYCSSDDWSGDRSSSLPFNPGDPATWYFQGRRIALAAIASLPELGTGFHRASHIVLGGSSAGGLGVMVTANDILPVLPKSAASVRVVNDAGFAIEIGQFDESIAAPYVFKGQPTAFTELFEAGMALWHGRGDAKCDAAAVTPQAHAACYSALVLNAGYIGVPSFVAESQLDTAQLSDELCPAADGNCGLPHGSRSMQGQYAAAFSKAMVHSMRGQGATVAYGVYAPDAYMHTMLADAAQFTTKRDFANGKLSPQAVLNLWLKGAGSRVMEVGISPGLAYPKP